MERHVLVFTLLSKRRVEIPLCGCVAVGQIGPWLLLKRQQAAFSACFLHCHGLRASRRLLPQSRHTNRCSAISESANVTSHADRQDHPRVTLTVVRPTTDSTKGVGFVRCVSTLQNVVVVVVIVVVVVVVVVDAAVQMTPWLALRG